MCQVKALLEKDNEFEVVMEAVSGLEVLPGEIRLTAIFDEPVSLPETVIKKIDFLAGEIIISKL